MYHDLLTGKSIRKKETAIRFDVDERSIQRDISVLRSFFYTADTFCRTSVFAIREVLPACHGARFLFQLRRDVGSVQDPTREPVPDPAGVGADPE